MSYLLALTILLAPTYAIRFNLFGLPANFLMVWIAFVWAAFALTANWREFISYIQTMDKRVLIFSTLFFAAGLISLFYGGVDAHKLGQFIVLFLQPISLFLIAGFTFSKNPGSKSLLLATCYLLLATMGLIAVVQYFTLNFLPPAYWGNSVEPKRAVGFFIHPNFFALFITPLLAFLLPDSIRRCGVIPSAAEGSRDSSSAALLRMTPQKKWLPLIFWCLGTVGLFLSLSRAGWMGLAAAIGVYLIFAASKNIRKAAAAAIVVITIVVIATPNLRYRLLLPFKGEKSTVSRYSLWYTGWKGIKESPVLGLGLTGFSQNWNRLNTDPNLDSHNFPHNIFLNLWVETGIVGLISLLGLVSLMIYQGLRFARNDVLKLGISLFLIALVTQGMFDNPFLKNDLALIFWIMVSLAI